MPGHLVDLVQIIEVEGMGELGMPIAKRPRVPKRGGAMDRAYDMDDVLLTAQVVLVSAVDNIEHDRAWAKVEGDIMPDHRTGMAQHREFLYAALLDATHADDIACKS